MRRFVLREVILGRMARLARVGGNATLDTVLFSVQVSVVCVTTNFTLLIDPTRNKPAEVELEFPTPSEPIRVASFPPDVTKTTTNPACVTGSNALALVASDQPMYKGDEMVVGVNQAQLISNVTLPGKGKRMGVL